MLATPSSETVVGVLYRAKTANAKIAEWKPLHAFPAKKAARAYTHVNTVQSGQAFFRGQHLEMEIHPDMIWVPPGNYQLGSPYEEADRFADEGPQQLTVLPVGFWVHTGGVHQVDG
jgi:formylglycine-generating enzyme required for sulfatase activity